MRSTPAAYAAAVALIAAGAGGAAVVERVSDGRAESAAQRRSETTVEVFQGVMGDLARTTGTIEEAGTIGLTPASVARLLSDRSVITGVSGLARIAGSPVLRAGTSAVPGPELVAGTRLARDASADTGEMHVAVPSPGSIAFVLPKYADRASTATTDERRAALVGWMIATVDAQKFVRRLGATDAAVELAVDGIRATTGSSDAARDAVQADGEASLANATWSITVRPTLPGGMSAAARAILVAAAIAALAAIGVGVRDRRRLDRIREEHEALLRETRVVTELGPILQASLDLGEVLPAVAVHLCDEFGLLSVALELIGDDGNLVEVFSMGARPARGRAAVGTPLAELVCPLIRSGRTIGRLRAIPVRPLQDTDVAAIQAAAELIAVTTSNVELYEREQATVRRLVELDRLKDAFLGTISHELRTPITAIRGFVQLLCERWGDFGDDDRQEFLRRIQRNSTSLGLLVDDLLDFARIERQSIVVTPTRVRLDLAAGSLVRQLTPLLGQHHIVTELNAEVEAIADVSALDRVLANLLTNAAKFSPPGTAITIATRVVDDYAELSVADEGAGIADVDRPRIFTRFYRGDGAVAKATRGAGIGLSVVRELVVQMGGEIEVQDNVPHGTRMVVRLPGPGGRSLRIPDQLAPAHPEPARRS